MGYTATYTVGIGDINYGNHLGNDKALLIFHDARIQFLNHFGLSEINIGENKGIILVDAQLKYQKQVKLHQKLLIEIDVEIENNKKFNLHYQMKNVENEQLLISGSTGMLCFDYADQKVKQLPQSFIELFKQF
ncbi:MAG: thioesterase family protein [Bacteroidota bacterium]